MEQPDLEALGIEPNPDRLLLQMVQQDIRPADDGHYFSGFVRLHAEVLRYLCVKGLMVPSQGYEDRLEHYDRDFCAEMPGNKLAEKSEDPTPKPTYHEGCFFCESTIDIRLGIIELVPGSPGVIRPVCKKFLNPTQDDRDLHG